MNKLVRVRIIEEAIDEMFLCNIKGSNLNVYIKRDAFTEVVVRNAELSSLEALKKSEFIALIEAEPKDRRILCMANETNGILTSILKDVEVAREGFYANTNIGKRIFVNTAGCDVIETKDINLRSITNIKPNTIYKIMYNSGLYDLIDLYPSDSSENNDEDLGMSRLVLAINVRDTNVDARCYHTKTNIVLSKEDLGPFIHTCNVGDELVIDGEDNTVVFNLQLKPTSDVDNLPIVRKAIVTKIFPKHIVASDSHGREHLLPCRNNLVSEKFVHGDVIEFVEDTLRVYSDEDIVVVDKVDAISKCKTMCTPFPTEDEVDMSPSLDYSHKIQLPTTISIKKTIEVAREDSTSIEVEDMDVLLEELLNLDVSGRIDVGSFALGLKLDLTSEEYKLLDSLKDLSIKEVILELYKNK